jgi:hypothetical protein
MPEEIVARILRLPGLEVYAVEAGAAGNTMTLASGRPGMRRRTAVGLPDGLPSDSRWTERRIIRDLPWGTWQVRLQVEVHRVRCPQCGVRTERRPRSRS